MTRRALTVLAAAALAVAASAGGASAGQPRSPRPAPAASPPTDALPAGGATKAQGKPYWHMLSQYCEGCHSVTDWAGGVAFATMRPGDIPTDAKVWEAAINKLDGHLMPPPGHKRPSQARINAFIAWMSRHLDAAAAAHPDPGFVELHRLNRREYARSVDAILGLKVDAKDLLPKDTLSDDFDDIADVLKVSPTFLDQYISAAQKVAALAVGNPHAAKAIAVYNAGKQNQRFHVEGLPLGTRGGMVVTHDFPADGEYRFDLSVYTGIGYLIGLDHPNQVVLSIDGQKVFERSIGGARDLKEADQHPNKAKIDFTSRFENIWVRVPAGPHRISVAFIAKSLAASNAWLEPLNPRGGSTRVPVIQGLKITGPVDPTGVSATPSRKKIFICHPTQASEERPCAHEILAKLAREAFRRPVSRADLRAPMRLYEQGRQAKGFDTGIENGIVAILTSPKFLFRADHPAKMEKAGGIYRISDLDLASRLSFFLWGEGPDEQLIELGAEHKLHQPRVLARQVRRMLADPRAESLVTGFAFQWLEMDSMYKIVPDKVEYPGFDEDLRSAYRTEMRLFLDSILLKDRDVLDLLTADWTYVNERLALEYDVPNVQGQQFRRVILKNRDRWGLLGKGAILMGTSYANRTSPVRRGAWILDVITDTPPNAPPPAIPPLIENVPGHKPLTIRQRMQMHRRQPSCNSCHGIMDPMGFAMQNFNAMGGWQNKDRDTGTLIDASGRMADGTRIDGVGQLRDALLRNPQVFLQGFTRKLMTYALGRTLDYHDMPVVRAIVRDAAHHHDRFSAIVLGIVTSPEFQTERIAARRVRQGAYLKTAQVIKAN